MSTPPDIYSNVRGRCPQIASILSSAPNKRIKIVDNFKYFCNTIRPRKYAGLLVLARTLEITSKASESFSASFCDVGIMLFKRSFELWVQSFG